MRAIGVLAVAALVALDANFADAQSTRHFRDSWFWGLKGGALNYQVQSDPSGLSPLVGADWLITRKQGGLYVAFDHAFFKRDSVFVNDSISPLDTVPRTIILSGMRRFTLAGMLFPLDNKRLMPYLGLGASLSSVAKVVPQGSFRNSTQENLVLATVNQFKTVASPVVMVGLQMRLLYVSAFGQLTTSPTNNNFFLFTQSGWRSTAEFGLRYNMGSSIDRMR